MKAYGEEGNMTHRHSKTHQLILTKICIRDCFCDTYHRAKFYIDRIRGFVSARFLTVVPLKSWQIQKVTNFNVKLFCVAYEQVAEPRILVNFLLMGKFGNKKRVGISCLLRTRHNFIKLVIVSVAMSELGCIDVISVEPKAIVNGYRA